MTVQIGPMEFDHVVYDAKRDVLYLSVGEPREAADSLVTSEGHVLRYGIDNTIIGITLINAKWLTERDGTIHLSLPVEVQDLTPAFA
jgi:uncharacterized protein YuzE